MKQEELNKKAEEAAREVYTYTFQGMDDLIVLFLAGYKLAEKDLALTWEDIRKIVTLFSEVSYECFDYMSANEFCEETLRRFKEAKNDGNGTVHP